MSSAPEPRLIREACRLALDVAFDGERADPPLPAPPGLRQMFAFRKLSRASIATIAKVIDHDDEFRSRVAAEATEEKVGRAGYLWLTRPEGWQVDPAWATEPSEAADPGSIARLRRERQGAEAKADRYRREAEESEAARRRALEQLDEAQQRARAAEQERDDASAQLVAVADERTRAVRSLKAVEADLADARRALRVARDATREAEADRLALEERIAALEAAAATGPGGSSDAGPGPIDRSGSVPESFDPTDLRRAVRLATATVADLARALDGASAALDPPSPVRDLESGASQGGVTAGRSPGGVPRRSPRRGRPRRRAALPPGVLEGSSEGDRHLVASGDVMLVVDGYNLARARWSDLTPQEERRRTVRLLEEAQARSGARVIVVFDGVSGEVSPAASRAISVRYSPTGVTADDLILDTVAALPDDEPVVVVSSDREVADGARDLGATAMGSAAFLAAADR